MNKKGYVYILFNKKHGTLYVGVTSNLVKRIYEHKNKFADGFTKKYTQTGEKYEQILMEHKLECVQTQVVLTNTSARIIKDKVTSKRFIMLNQFLDGGINVAG